MIMLCRGKLHPICNFPQVYGYIVVGWQWFVVVVVVFCWWREILPIHLPTSFLCLLKMDLDMSVSLEKILN